MRLHDLLDQITAYLDKHPKDADKISEHALAHELSPEILDDNAVILPAVAWYRRICHDGEGKTVMSTDAPGHRYLGFVIYDQPDSEEGQTFYTPLRSIKEDLPEHIRMAVSNLTARMKLCHLISAGEAPEL